MNAINLSRLEFAVVQLRYVAKHAAELAADPTGAAPDGSSQSIQARFHSAVMKLEPAFLLLMDTAKAQTVAGNVPAADKTVQEPVTQADPESTKPAAQPVLPPPHTQATRPKVAGGAF